MLAARDPTTRRVSSPAEAFLVTSALRGAVERGTGRSLRGLGFDGVVAAKSGTTNEFRDGWFIGYTPTLAVAVWVGFDDGRSLGLPGARVALPIFSRFMVAATGPDGERGPWGSRGFERPGGLEIVEIDRRTGLRAGPGCPGQRELFLSGTAPRRSCSPYGAYVYGSGESSWPGRPPRSAARLEPELRRLLGALAGGDETDVRAALERVLREPDLRARARALLQSLTDEARLER